MLLQRLNSNDIFRKFNALVLLNCIIQAIFFLFSKEFNKEIFFLVM